MYPYGAVDVFERDGVTTFKVNGQRLKPYFEDIPSIPVEDVSLEDPLIVG